jgi:F-box-like
MDVSIDLDRISANPPLALSPFTTSNDELPSHLSSCLEEYLQKISDPMDALETEIAALEKLLRSKRGSYKRAKMVRDAHAKIKAPVRKVPPELLGAIIHLAVDTPPFNGYQDVSRVRGVCSSWRRVALMTPGLWTTLTIDLDRRFRSNRMMVGDEREASVLHFQRALSPWASILSNKYHLKILSVQALNKLPDCHQSLIRFLLWESFPAPRSLTLPSDLVLSEVTKSTTSLPLVLKVVIQDSYLDDLAKLKNVFPNLKSLVIMSVFEGTYGQFTYPSLQFLHLCNFTASPDSFAYLMQALPHLRQLRLACYRYRTQPLPGSVPTSPVAHTHAYLESLTTEDYVEDTLLLLSKVKFTALRFMAIYVIPNRSPNSFAAEIVHRILSESSVHGFVLSLSGNHSKQFVEHIMQGLPPNSRLHFVGSLVKSEDLAPAQLSLQSDVIEEIFCDEETGDLRWLDAGRQRSSSRPLYIYIPQDAQCAGEALSRREELEGAGYCLKLMGKEEYADAIYSLAPELVGEDRYVFT